MKRRKAYMNAWQARYRIEHPKRILLQSAKGRARKKGLAFSLTEQDVVIPLVCPVLGIPLKRASKQHDGSPTIDRLNVAIGYVPGNVRVISQRANRIKNDATAAELAAVLAYVRGKL